MGRAPRRSGTRSPRRSRAPARPTTSASQRAHARCFVARVARGICCVGDVAHQQVPEHVLGLAPEARRSRGPDQLPAHGVLEQPTDLVLLASADPRDGARPEHLADHGGIVHQRPEVERQGVEARARSPPAATRGRGSRACAVSASVAVRGEQATVGQHLHEFLGVQGVATAPLRSAWPGSRRAARRVPAAPRPAARSRRSVSGRPAGSWSQPGTVLPSRDVGRAARGGRGAQDEQGQVAVLSRQVLDELQHRRRRPSAGPRSPAPTGRAGRGPPGTGATPRRARRAARRPCPRPGRQERGEPGPQPPALRPSGTAASMAASSFGPPSTGSSSSMMPASALTASASAQKLTPSP